MKKISVLFFAVLLSSFAFAQEQYVIMISMDGFRWDYPQRYHTPTLDSLAQVGVKAHSLQPCFPSKTFPNHYSMATGLYPDHHGIVNNSFYAPEYNESFSLGNDKAKYDPKFYGGEPIWNTAERQGVKSASFFWVGSDISINGRQPSRWKMYDGRVPFMERVDSVVSWLKLPVKERPRLVLLYFQEPDGISHRTGPDSPQTKAMVEELDGVLASLCRKLNALPIGKQINLVIVSDHGMARVHSDKVIELSSKIKPEWVEQLQADNPAMNIKAKAPYYDSVYLALKSFKNLYAWKSSEVPARLNYGKNPRTLDFVVTPDSLWSVTWKVKPQYEGASQATHGWDPAFTQMHGIFYGVGPMFPHKQQEVPTFENLNVYNIVCKILGITPAPNDGDPKVVDMVLQP